MQEGTPQELFERPAHRFVGYFIGSPGMNFLPCRSTADGARRSAGQRHSVRRPGSRRRRAGGGALEIGVRPEAVGFSRRHSAAASPAEIRDVEDLGNCKIATCRLGEHERQGEVPPERPIPLDRGTV